LVPEGLPIVLTIHNLSHQGQTGRHFLYLLGPRGLAYEAADHVNLLAGGIRLADEVIAVSEHYAREIVDPAHGCGLHELLAAKGDRLVGIRNGIDTARWNPATDDHLLANFDVHDLSGKELCTKELRRFAGFEGSRGPVIGLVARFVHQKGIDLALDLLPFLANLPAHLVVLGAGEPRLMAMAERAELAHPDRMWFARGYDDALAHQLIAGSDLLLVPSRFEPCGLTQMEAMAYGTIPVVSDVGGLHDTVIDANADPRLGTGYVAAKPDAPHLLDALHRAVRGFADKRRRRAMQVRAMSAGWSWQHPAAAHIDLYRSLHR
jgi:starch synthase